MAINKKYTTKFKRTIQGRTNYRARLKLVLSKFPRITVRSHLNNILIQLIQFNPDGDKILVLTHSKELTKYGWKYHRGNIPSAYLTGLLFGKKMLSINVKEAVLDIGMSPATKGSRPFAALKGILDAGIKVPHSKEILPSEDALKGKNIVEYAKIAPKDSKQFSYHIKNNILLEQISDNIEKTKELILKSEVTKRGN